MADRGSRRVQLVNSDLQNQRIIEGMGAPVVRPASTQVRSNCLFTGDGSGKIYKFELDGKLVGWAQTSENHGQNGCLVHELHCRVRHGHLQRVTARCGRWKDHHRSVTSTPLRVTQLSDRNARVLTHPGVLFFQRNKDASCGGRSVCRRARCVQ